MSQEYNIRKIGSIGMGIDGKDEFFQVTCEEPIDKAQLWERFHDEFYYESQQEAGGYFCKRYSLYTQQNSEYKAVLVIHHEYDV